MKQGENGPALQPGAKSRRAGWWSPKVARAVFIAFVLLVVVLLALKAREVDWPRVWQALRAYPATTLAAAAALVVVSYVVYAGYDLLGRRYVRHDVGTLRVLGVAFVSYAFNLNLGSLIGGVGFRLRLYSRLGLRPGAIGRLIGFSLVTNWSGYLLLAGALLATRRIEWPDSVAPGGWALQVLGFALLAAALSYLALAAFSRRRHWTVRGHRFTLPGTRMALAQIAISSLNWALIGAVLTVLIPSQVGYALVLATLLTGAIIAAFTHIPGGIGVLEAAFVIMLGSRVPEGQLVAALLVYRALYYWAPLALAAALHFTLEATARRAAGRPPPRHAAARG